MRYRSARPENIRRLKRRTATEREIQVMGLQGRNRPLIVFLPTVWLLLTFVSIFDFQTRDPRAILSRGASFQNLLELGAFAVVGLLALDVLVYLIRQGGRGDVGRGVGLLGIFGGLILLSSVWSQTPTVTLARGVEASVVVLLTYVSVRLWRDGYRSLGRDWRTYWLAYVGVIGLLEVSGLLWPDWPNGRFAFPGVHPVATGALLAVASVAGVSMLLEPSWQLRRVHRMLIGALAGASGVFLLLTRTRSSLFGLLAALVVLFLFWTRRREGWRPLVAPVFVIAIVGSFVLFFNQIWLFILRDQTTQQFSAGTGRRLLIEPAIELFAEHPYLGLGHGAGRFVFLDEFEWATHGHNLLIELAVDLGLLGLFAGVAVALWSAVAAVQLHRLAPGHVTHMALGWFLTSVGIWVADPGFALVGDSYTLLALFVGALAVGLELNRPRSRTVREIIAQRRETPLGETPRRQPVHSE